MKWINSNERNPESDGMQYTQDSSGGRSLTYFVDGHWHSETGHPVMLWLDEQNDGWISCEDRLPENEKDQDFVRVIVTVFDLVRKPLTMFAIYHNENFYGAEMWWSDGADSPTMTNSVTHWQPLPAAPLVNNLNK